MLALPSGLDWEVQAPAKLNLWFEILARRSDGFHEVSTLMVPISLKDTLTLRPAPTGKISLQCKTAAPGKEHELWTDLPEDDRNLVVKAVNLLKQRSGSTLGANIVLTKRIPAAAGLGGGSSNAAAALVAANKGWDLNWPVEKLAEVAAEIGSDVPFFLYPGAAMCRGRGEQISPVGGLGKMHFVVVRPPVGLSTAEVYGKCQISCQPDTPEPLLDALRSGKLAKAGNLMINRLQFAAETLTATIKELACAMNRANVVAHQMSGSGSSYFGLCRSAKHARHVAGWLRQQNLGHVVAVSSCA